LHGCHSAGGDRFSDKDLVSEPSIGKYNKTTLKMAYLNCIRRVEKVNAVPKGCFNRN